MDYKSAGVDVEKGDQFVENIKKKIARTYNKKVVSGVGGFSAIYKLSDNHYLSAGTDGVGTKVKLAAELNIHHTIGQDLVAMCVNDIICSGATPEFFLDYLATSKLDLAVHEKVIEGISNACLISGCALIGGETAEMPEVYPENIYDLAGFAVGHLTKESWIDGQKVVPGATLIGIPSSGFHSNGFSLIRKLLVGEDDSLKKSALTPTEIYSPLVLKVLADQFDNILGMAHITGGGFHNIPRMNESFGYEISECPTDNHRPKWMNYLIKKSKLPDEELYTTFNMGIGFVFAVSDKSKLIHLLDKLGQSHLILGKVVDSYSGLRIKN